MYNFLVAAYSMRIKKMYLDIKDIIPKKLTKSLIKNRDIVTKIVIPKTDKAYKEGIEYAKVFPGFEDVGKIDNTYTQKTKKKIFENFFIIIKNAERIYKLRVENWKRILKLNNRTWNSRGAQELQFWKEYENEIQKAANNSIIQAGAEGQRAVWREK